MVVLGELLVPLASGGREAPPALAAIDGRLRLAMLEPVGPRLAAHAIPRSTPGPVPLQRFRTFSFALYSHLPSCLSSFRSTPKTKNPARFSGQGWRNRWENLYLPVPPVAIKFQHGNRAKRSRRIAECDSPLIACLYVLIADERLPGLRPAARFFLRSSKKSFRPIPPPAMAAQSEADRRLAGLGPVLLLWIRDPSP